MFRFLCAEESNLISAAGHRSYCLNSDFFRPLCSLPTPAFSSIVSCVALPLLSLLLNRRETGFFVLSLSPAPSAQRVWLPGIEEKDGGGGPSLFPPPLPRKERRNNSLAFWGPPPPPPLFYPSPPSPFLPFSRSLGSREGRGGRGRGVPETLHP